MVLRGASVNCKFFMPSLSSPLSLSPSLSLSLPLPLFLPDSITKLPPGMESGPFYGHKCLLAGIQPPSLFSNMAPPSWSQKAITHFKNAAAPEEDEEINVVMKVNNKNHTLTPHSVY